MIADPVESALYDARLILSEQIPPNFVQDPWWMPNMNEYLSQNAHYIVRFLEQNLWLTILSEIGRDSSGVVSEAASSVLESEGASEAVQEAGREAAERASQEIERLSTPDDGPPPEEVID